MPLKGKSLLNLIFKALSRDLTHFIFSGVGLVVGTSTLTLFLALSSGIRERVINRIYPVNFVEVEPAKVSRIGLISDATKIDDAVVEELRRLRSVVNVYPKQRSKFQATLWGGASMFGRDAHAEAFFDGIEPALIEGETMFADYGEAVPCSSDEQCVEGAKCEGGLCSGSGDMKPLRCTLNDPRDQFSDDEELLRGTVVSDYRGAQQADYIKQCPEGTYCAAVSVVSKEGFCEKPVPVLLAPFLLEVYNNVAATALGLPRIELRSLLKGVKFSILYGESYFVSDMRVDRRVKKIAQISGFSDLAMDFGVTMPLPYVMRANARYQGKESAKYYSSVIVETRRNEDIPAVVKEAERLNLTLSSKSEDGRKAANVLFVLTVVFSIISVIILLISAVNITHTFLMIVYERQHEIAVYRAIGASMNDIRKMFLIEAGLVGLTGGTAGVIVSYLSSRLLNAAILHFAHLIPFCPEDFFIYSSPLIFTGIAFAVVFAICGAYPPANRAAKTDPAALFCKQ